MSTFRHWVLWAALRSSSQRSEADEKRKQRLCFRGQLLACPKGGGGGGVQEMIGVPGDGFLQVEQEGVAGGIRQKRRRSVGSSSGGEGDVTQRRLVVLLHQPSRVEKHETCISTQKTLLSP